MTLDLIGLTGTILSIVDQFYVMMIGKFLFGIAVGGLLTLTPRIIEETVPVQHFESGYGSMTMIGIDIYMILCMF